MAPERARLLARLLDVGEPGEELPPFFHQVYFWDPVAPTDLGRDGHPALGPFVPDLGLPRRMWAGGRLRFHAPVRFGVPAEKTTDITSVTEKSGRSGRLAFVTLRHTIRQSGQIAVEEEQDLVYRAEHRPGDTAARHVAAENDADPILMRFDPVLLFRYSALTWNGHRIHYDAEYARTVEGYGGLVVHGPLLAQLLMLRGTQAGRLAAFSFRGVRPLLVSERATLCQKDARLWVRNDAGALIMTAEAKWH